MKRIILSLTLFLVLNMFVVNFVEAKPAYCWEAYKACLEKCGVLVGVGCGIGCWIGYLNCGS